MFFFGRASGRIGFMAAVLLLFATAASLHARGGRDESALPLADRLIADREFDEAIRVLSTYVRDNPDRFDEGQIRLRRIVRTRELFNYVVHLLLDTVEEEPENDERILELSNLILTIESPTNVSVQTFLAQIRLMAELNINRRQLERIFLVAREQLARNDFSGALATYASGLNLFQEAFFTSGYGEEAHDIASSGLADIARNIQEFNDLSPRFAQPARQLAAMDTPTPPSPGELSAAFELLAPMMEELAAIREDFFRIRESYTNLLAVLQEEHDIMGDRSFLSIAGWLISGPVGQQEGMAGTLEQFWHYMVDPAEIALTNIVGRSFQAGYAAMADFDFTAGLSLFEGTAQYVAVATEMVRRANSFTALGDAPAFIIDGEALGEERIGVYLEFRGIANSLPFLQETGVLGLRGRVIEDQGYPALGAWRAGTLGTPQAVSMERELRGAFQEVLGGLLSLHAGLDSEIGIATSSIESFGDGAPGGTGELLAHFLDARSLVVRVSNHFGRLEFNSAIRKYTMANADLESRVMELEGLFNEGNTFIAGFGRWEEGYGLQTVRYNHEGIAILDRVGSELVAGIAVSTDLLAEYAGEVPVALATPEMGALYAAAQNLHSRLVSLQSQNTAALALGSSQLDRANALRVDGDRLFQAAQSSLVQNDFNASRSNLVRAIEQYDSSLALQESASLRAFRDNDVVNFATEIVRVENEVVIRDVRDLLTSARTSYFAGNLEHAENLLVQAQNRWRVTNVAEQPEVEHWLRLVRGALSLNLARVISPTAPLFAEMSQLLSTANLSYTEGVSLINAGQRPQGMALFSDALDKTREVRLMFPMNHSARMLELRIEQRTDLAAFNASFEARLNAARAGTREGSLEAFTDLQDLAEINPQFPGIQGILVQAEIDMGFRPPPPNPADIARSAELTRTAAAHVNSGDPVLFGVAETQLGEAISLDPNNTQAQSLMDQLQTLMTGTGTFVLSSHAQSQYNQALQEFLRGNHLTANAIVLQLLQNPENQRSTLVQDLRRRIDAVL